MSWDELPSLQSLAPICIEALRSCKQTCYVLAVGRLHRFLPAFDFTCGFQVSTDSILNMDVFKQRPEPLSGKDEG